MRRELLIHGATGYTGRLLARAAAVQGLQPILAGRDAVRLQAVAAPLRLRHRVIAAENVERQLDALRDVAVLLNAAGPFATAPSWIDACLRSGTHYLDVAGELATFAALAPQDALARQRGIMVMPGVGFLVVAADCLAAHVTAQLPGATRLCIGTSRSLLLSRGSLKTMLGLVADAVTVRRDGVLTPVALGAVEHQLDYGDGPRRSTAMSMPELITAFHTTGIGNIDACVEVTAVERAAFQLAAGLSWLVRNPLAQVALQTQAELLPEGPAAENETGRAVVVEADDGHGRTVAARLRTPEAYRFTAAAAVLIADRVLRGELQPGFQTPAAVYGSDFVLAIDGVRREDIPPSR